MSSGESYPILVSEHGQLSIGEVLLAAVKTAAAGTTLDGTYTHVGYVGYIGVDPFSESWIDELTFRADGTFENGRIVIGPQLAELGASTEPADVLHETGKYEIAGNTITLTFDDGTA